MKKIFISSLFLLFAFCSSSFGAEIMMGADGAMYKKEGNTIISSKGIVYQVSGNTILGSDGSICQNINGIVNCRNVKDSDNNFNNSYSNRNNRYYDRNKSDNRYNRNDREYRRHDDRGHHRRNYRR